MKIKQNKTHSDSHWKVEKLINKSDIDDIFESIYTTVILNIKKSI